MSQRSQVAGARLIGQCKFHICEKNPKDWLRKYLRLCGVRYTRQDDLFLNSERKRDKKAGVMLIPSLHVVNALQASASTSSS